MPGRFGNFFGRLVDRVLPGYNYNPQTGQYSNIGFGLTGLGLRGVAGLLGGPAGSILANKGLNWYANNHGYGDPTMGVPSQGLIPTNPSVNVPDLGGNLGFGGSIGFPTNGYNPFTIPTTGGSPYDQFAPPSGNIFDPTGTFSGNPGYSSGGSAGGYQGNGGMNWAQNAGGGASQGGGIGFGWTGVSGDAARSMFSGMASASDDAVQAKAAAQMRKLRQ